MNGFTRASRLAVLVFLVAVGGAACSSSSSSEPTRPPGVPADAFWVGGSDGGAFVQLRRDGVGYSGAVYHADGERWFTGPFRLEPAGASAVDPSDHAAFTGWDGSQLLMTGGRALVSEQP